jgi:hypothetical protein
VKSQLVYAVVAGAALLAMPAHATDVIAIKVVVKLREKVEDKTGQPFADVGGFTLRRNNAVYSRATCPDLSNARGELVCKLQCDADDGSMRLNVVAPSREQARIVANLTPPNQQAIEVTQCKVISKLPVEMAYRGLDVTYSELLTANPSIFNAIAATGDSKKFKPFVDAAGSLEKVAKDPKQRAVLLELGSLAAAAEGASLDRVTWASNAVLSQYATGLNSVVLKAMVDEAAGAELGSTVKISANTSDFQRSVTAVQKGLDAKPLLTQQEIVLANELKTLKTGGKLTPSQLRNMDIGGIPR